MYHKIYDLENLKLADLKARRGKRNRKCVKDFDKDKETKLVSLSESLKNKSYNTSEYTTFEIFEPKPRTIFRLPYFPDRITHHAIVNVVEPIFLSTFTADTYSCIKKRGILSASMNLRKALEDKEGAKYCLKIDIKKYYPNVDNNILKQLLRKKFKDKDLLWLFDNIIDSTDGLPIGNLMSQLFGNFYLTYFDHFIKEDKKVKYFFRYCDDMIFLSDNKEDLHKLLKEIKEYLWDNLKLTVKENHRIFPVHINGIDFVGYVHFHTHVKLRKGIKKKFAKMLFKYRNKKSISAYNGWLMYSNCKNLRKKLLRDKI